jgi:hypothetical protein
MCRKPNVVFAPIPQNVRFAKNITHFLALKDDHKNIRNFGHAVFEGLASMYHAMESFDLLESGARLVHFQNVSISNFILGPWKAPRSGYFYLFPHISAFIEEYPSGTCFHKMVVGHTAVASIWNKQFSVHRAAHIARFRRFYLHHLQLDNVVARSHRRKKIVVNFYPRHVRGWRSCWKDVCKLSMLLEEVFMDVEFRCVSLHSMSIELQAISRNLTSFANPKLSSAQLNRHFLTSKLIRNPRPRLYLLPRCMFGLTVSMRLPFPGVAPPNCILD